MEIQHGGLLIDLPHSWSDQSSLLFVAPREEESLPTTAAVQRPTEAVAVGFVLAESRDARAILTEQTAQLAAAEPTLEVVAEGPFSCGLGPGWSQTQKLTVGETAVRQLSVACLIGHLAVVATASAAEARFKRCEEQLSSILKSLRSTNSKGSAS